MLHLISRPAPVPSLPWPVACDGAHRVEHLGDQIAELAARLHAATYELLVLLREFDVANGWNNGFLSCAHWLSWRTGIDLGTAREKVRVARALAGLPLVSDAMRRGELSYAKVRAITRIGAPENEARLVDAARAATAAQIERDVGRRRRTIPPALRRALIARDRHCRFPGCAARRCDAHHIDHWIDGGSTSLLNGTLLCRTHHGAVHEGGFSIRRERDGTLTFLRPDGVPLEPVPPSPMWMLADANPLGPAARRLREAGITIDAHTCTPRDGGPINIPWAIDVLRIPASDIDGSPLPPPLPRRAPATP